MKKLIVTIAIAATTGSVLAAVLLPAKEMLHVYLLIGQSNMAGRGALTKDSQIPLDRVVLLENNGRWAEAREPLHLDKRTAGAGLGASFARTMADADPSVTIGLVPCAFGGTSLDEWMPGRYLYRQAVLRAAEAMQNGVLKGILWHQGEADASNRKAAETYADRLVKMMTSLRADLKAEDVPIVVGELAPYLDQFVAKNGSLGEWRLVNEKLHEAVARLPKCKCASAADLNEHIGDCLHLSTKSLRTFGVRYAEALLSMGRRIDDNCSALQFPRRFYEIDASGRIVHLSPHTGRVTPGRHFAGTGFWDTVRALYPLLNFAYPEIVGEMMEGLENCWHEAGWLPEWSNPGFVDCMIGQNSVSVVASAHLQGIKGHHDMEELYKALVRGANGVHPKKSVGHLGWEYYNELGYVPQDVGIPESVARTIEYAYDDYAIARLAEALGKKEDATLYRKCSGNWRNVFGQNRGLAVGRNRLRTAIAATRTTGRPPRGTCGRRSAAIRSVPSAERSRPA